MTERVNLNKANKLMEKLKNLVKNFKLESSQQGWMKTTDSLNNYVTINYAYQGAEKMKDQIREATENGRRMFEEYFSLLRDQSNLKNALFKGNIESGVSKILSDLEDEKKYKSVWEKLQKSTNSNKSTEIQDDSILEYYTTQCKRHETLAISDAFLISRELYDQETLKKYILNCNKEINRLEDERDKLNHTFEIEICLSNTTKHLLGLSK